MEPLFYHVNMRLDGKSSVIWSPEIDDVLPAERVMISATPVPAEDSERDWSPAHLFIASVSSSILSKFVSLARKSRLEFTHITVKSTGKVLRTNGRMKLTEVMIVPRIGIDNSAVAEECERVLEKARSECLICNSVPIKVTIKPYIEHAVTS